MKRKLPKLTIPLVAVNLLLMAILSKALSTSPQGGVQEVGVDVCGPRPRVDLPFIMNTYFSYFEDAWEHEPNNEDNQANGLLRSGRAYNGYPNDPKDYFSFYMQIDGLINVDLSNMVGAGQLQLFYGSINNPVGPYAYQEPYQITYTGTAGLYYIYIATISGFSTTSAYTLTATYPIPPLPPTATPAPSPTPWVGYRFEADTQGWTTTEGDYKLADLDTTRQVVCQGRQALQLTTELSGNSTDPYRHTEALAYFTDAIPEGLSVPGPYNLVNKVVSCFVYFPSGWASSGNPQVYTRLFVKDEDYDNQFSNPIDIRPSSANKWLQLSLRIISQDPFNAEKVLSLGVRTELQSGSTFENTGEIYIDECLIEYP